MTRFIAVLAVALVGAVMAMPGHAQETPPLLGDADCSARVSSLDAAVTLQYAAALSGSVPCPLNADVDGAGAIDSIDANLMLQTSADLVPGFVRMTLSVEQEGLCSGDVCTIGVGTSFTVSVDLESLPEAGFDGFQSFVFFDHLTYDMTENAADEVVWPDARFVVRAHPESGDDNVYRAVILHGATSAQLPPYSLSTYTGPLVTITLRCPDQPNVNTIALRSYTPESTLGAGVHATNTRERVFPSQVIRTMDLDIDLDGTIRAGSWESSVPVSSVLTIHCV